jgi:hypothetical protein
MRAYSFEVTPASEHIELKGQGSYLIVPEDMNGLIYEVFANGWIVVADPRKSDVFERDILADGTIVGTAYKLGSTIPVYGDVARPWIKWQAVLCHGSQNEIPYWRYDATDDKVYRQDVHRVNLGMPLVSSRTLSV